jgi:hypothetical protein
MRNGCHAMHQCQQAKEDVLFFFLAHPTVLVGTSLK